MSKTSQSIEEATERKQQGKPKTSYKKQRERTRDASTDHDLPDDVLVELARIHKKHPSPKQTPAFYNSSQFQPGQNRHSTSSPTVFKGKSDFAREIARLVFEKNPEALYRAFRRALLKGNAYAFGQLADRAYGKLKETTALEINDLRDVPTETLNERIAQLERELGYADAIDQAAESARTAIDQARSDSPDSTPQA